MLVWRRYARPRVPDLSITEIFFILKKGIAAKEISLQAKILVVANYVGA